MVITGVSIDSVNCRGLANKKKRIDIFNKFKEKNTNILCLQDVHLEKWEEAKIRNEWRYEVFLSAFNTHSRGVMILLNNNFEYKVNHSLCDKEGNFIILDITLQDEVRFTLATIYGPNKDSPSFFEKLWVEIENFNNSDTIICGDWNVVRNYKVDTHNYLHENNKGAKLAIDQGVIRLDLSDVWRIHNPDTYKFTWWCGSPAKKARLDYFMVSQRLLGMVSKCAIHGRYKSDHASINLTLTMDNAKRGPNYWKLNTKLLDDDELRVLIKKEISLIKTTYACTPYHPDYALKCPNKDIQLTIDETLFWETMLTQIRGVIITYSMRKNRACKRLERDLSSKLEVLEQECNCLNPDPNKINELEETGKRLNEIRENKLRGVMMRSRAQWLEFGEKPTPYFLSLEKLNYVNKTIKEIQKTDIICISGQEEILKEVKCFYKNLYTERPRKTGLTESFKKLNIEEVPKIPEGKKHLREGEITMTELKRALDSTKNNKSPGLDGYPIEFFKAFWDDLSPFMLRSINNSFEKGSLPQSQKEGLITCLPKGDKPRKFLKNWRPISLLNSAYKLVSTVIANRIKMVLTDIISKEQKGFVEGRNISEKLSSFIT